MKSFEEYKNEKTSTLIVNGAILTALKDITQEINYALVMIKEFNDDGRRFARSLPEETTPKQLLIISDLLRLHGNNLLSLAHFLKPKNQLTIETILEASRYKEKLPSEYIESNTPIVYRYLDELIDTLQSDH